MEIELRLLLIRGSHYKVGLTVCMGSLVVLAASIEQHSAISSWAMH